MSDSLWPSWTIACQAPLHGIFARQEYWNGLPSPPPGDLPDLGIEPTSPDSPALASGVFTTRATWEAEPKTKDFLKLEKKKTLRNSMVSNEKWFKNYNPLSSFDPIWLTLVLLESSFSFSSGNSYLVQLDDLQAIRNLYLWKALSLNLFEYEILPQECFCESMRIKECLSMTKA